MEVRYKIHWFVEPQPAESYIMMANWKSVEETALPPDHPHTLCHSFLSDYTKTLKSIDEHYNYRVVMVLTTQALAFQALIPNRSLPSFWPASGTHGGTLTSLFHLIVKQLRNLAVKEKQKKRWTKSLSHRSGLFQTIVPTRSKILSRKKNFTFVHTPLTQRHSPTDPAPVAVKSEIMRKYTSPIRNSSRHCPLDTAGSCCCCCCFHGGFVPVD